MIDLRLLKEDIEAVAAKLETRGFTLDVVKFNELEASRKKLQITVENLQSERNASAKLIGKAKASGDDIKPLLDKVSNLKGELADLELKLNKIQLETHDMLLEMPNIPHESVPIGKSEDDNEVIRTEGDIPQLNFAPKDHVELGAGVAGLDFDTASKITGSRFVVMHGKIAKMHRALIQFMLDVHTEEHGYTEAYVPYLVNADSLLGTGQLPKFKKDLFTLKVADTLSENESERELFLIPTAEVPITNIYRDTISNENDLPIKRVSHTPCFRSEAGSYGRDTKGLIRQHQFEKIEMVQLVKAEHSMAALDQITENAETILKKLGLAYQVVSLCTGDTGFSSMKTYDLEVWLPSQNTYREISSCSNFGDFQTRRMKARWRNPKTNKTELLHSLNGSGLAVGRTLVAIIENYQNSDGSINVPEVLQPYMGGISRITIV